MRTLLLNGSPRPGGDTDALCAALPEEAPVCVETAFSQDAGIIGAAATVFSRQLDAVLER